jgi:Derlin-2/3
MNSPVQPNPSAGIVFRGRSNRLGGGTGTTRRKRTTSPHEQQNQGDGIAFRGRSYRLNE